MRWPTRTSRTDWSPFEDTLNRSALRIRHRLVGVAAIALIALVAIPALLAWRQYQDGRSRALGDAHTRVVLAGALLDSYFGGFESVLTTVAESPAVTSENTARMAPYLKRVCATAGRSFTGGIGWIDRAGMSRVTCTPGPVVNVADRGYFRAVISTGKPYVSEGIVARRTHKQVIVVAVPTHGPSGAVTGVLAGALIVTPTKSSQATDELGFQGLAILDRGDQSVFGGLGRPKNTALLARMRGESQGTLTNTTGLDGSADHIVVFASSPIPDWKIVIDRPRSAVFAAARHSLILELASIVAAAVVIAALFGWILMRARREDEEQSERVRQWNELTRTLGGASAAKDVSDALFDAIATAFPTAQTLVTLEIDNRLELVIGPSPPNASRPIQRNDEFALQRVAKLAYDAQAPVVIENELTLLDQYPRIHRALGRFQALYAVPLLTGERRRVGALTLLFEDERSLNESERSLVEAQAERAAQALVRATLFEREHEVAVRLQRSLLSDELPAIDGVDVAARYNAGSAGLEVGGDWYDAVRRPDGIVHFSIGDVAGRGLAAAGLMGQLRNAFRAYAYDQTSPAEIVRRLTRHIGDDEMATTVCISVDPYTRELAYSSAGHPPALLVDSEARDVIRLEGASSPPLGFAEPDSVREARLTIPADATLIAYTDGLVERRSAGIERGIELLELLIRGAAALDADGVAETILDQVVARRGADDDIAFLVARIGEVPARMHIEIPAHPAMLVGMRRRLQAWLTLRGVSEDERADIVLAVSEACNNAVEHAYEQGEGTIELSVEHTPERVEIRVEDFGRWRPAQPSDERGRGTSIMQSLMDDAEVWHDQRGTHVLLARRLTPAH